MDEVFRTEWPRLVAVLVRDFGDLQLAEDCAQDAFVKASEVWGVEMPIPERPGAWLTTAARRKALDHIRRSSSYKDKLGELEARARLGPETSGSSDLVDEQLALVLGCCHPALDLESQVALTLRLVAGLSTDQIARAFLVERETMSKRLSRAKTKVRSAGIPFRNVDHAVLVERVGAVRHVIYLIFNEGHVSHGSEELVRGDLCEEAAWLAALLTMLLPEDSESHALSALILLTDARRPTRVDADGIPVMLEHQDRTQWDRHKIQRGLDALRRAGELGHLGTLGIQALLASLHAVAPSFERTNWPRIVSTYDRLVELDSSAVVVLNRAIAVSYAEGPQAGLDAIDPLRPDLGSYLYFHSARAELLRRLDRPEHAADAYRDALGCRPSTTERAFLEQRLTEVGWDS